MAVSSPTMALRKRVLAVLREAGGQDVSTAEICRRAGFNNFEHHAYVGPQLRALARLGVITQTARPPGGAARWGINGADQSNAAFNAVLEGER